MVQSDKHFQDADVATLREFGALLNDTARLNLSIPQALKLVALLQRYNKIVAKVEAHVLEVVAVHEAPASTSEEAK